ncbi:AraC family transcriptional regulator of arabinose operon [Paenibacillus sp. V4I3]|uniref:AraC family transcriptional regulator n=1 Tax=unclassified Paenibacillus TaxID=185978 RepID=UPI00277D5909|nr:MULTISPECIES: AraC family transcriptional regulator [unclassified Paenibacillus]MDQ0874509.1 AraC family transcriptional regulator of arabinose operon [Paenibacillus sp. V4I3]MDQ0889732.1 AraC family transcriptional regulator of arabinose operon [Paenibacillus sp. V4I9]
MMIHTFQVEKPLQLVMTGKFVAPSPDWMHMRRTLMEYELFVQTKGILYIADEQEMHVLHEGDYLLMPPRTKQYGYQASDCSFYWLHFTSDDQLTGSYQEEAFECPAGSIAIPSKGTLRSADRIIVMMKQLQDSIRSYQDPTLNNYLATSILCELYNQTFRSRNASQPKLKQLQLFNDIVDYIKWNRGEQLQASHIAEHFGYNAKYLSHLFSKIAGVPLKRFILQQKIEAASFLLTDTNMTINEIALELGYHDSQHFMKSFKQMTNLTPTSFRNASANRLLFYK